MTLLIDAHTRRTERRQTRSDGLARQALDWEHNECRRSAVERQRSRCVVAARRARGDVLDEVNGDTHSVSNRSDVCAARSSTDEARALVRNADRAKSRQSGRRWCHGG
jgi:hypothetical protein